MWNSLHSSWFLLFFLEKLSYEFKTISSMWITLFSRFIVFSTLYTVQSHQPNNEGLYTPRLTPTRDSGGDGWLQGQASGRAREAGAESSQPFGADPFEFQPSDQAWLANTHDSEAATASSLDHHLCNFVPKWRPESGWASNPNLPCSGEIEWKIVDSI